MRSFENWFETLTGHAPHRWQSELAAAPEPRTRVIRIPTGFGKTLGVLATWLHHRVDRQDPRWPRRLVWTLPMRVLAEQTCEVARDLLRKLGALWLPGTAHRGKVGVHLLMGGADPGGDWNLHPEECAIFIGTQDMLLSRALNRGYAASRARWPMEFGLLNHDALWVLDEVQLMDVGLATSAQLQAFFDDDAPRGQRPRHSWWMSATLQHDWLRTVDTKPRHTDWTATPILLAPADRRSGLAAIRKSLTNGFVPADKHHEFALRCVAAHEELVDGESGRITLVICNTVDRAIRTYDAIKLLSKNSEVELVHGRFRPHERASWRDRFLARTACHVGVNRLIIATQVVEAGVDISAGCVVTELAPWSSLVQRFGRCARYGGTGNVLVIDRGRDEKSARPYEPPQLDGAFAALQTLEKSQADVGIATIEAYEQSLTAAARAELYPYQPAHLLVRRELDDLFDTTPDLTGADIDISRFIRSGEERDLSIFWLDVPKPKKGQKPTSPPKGRRPSRDELCNVPFLRAQDWLCGTEAKASRKPRLKTGLRAWIWDWIEGDWLVVNRSNLTPGKVICVANDVGGYSIDRGFDADSPTAVMPVPRSANSEAQEEADDLEDSESLSASQWKTIATHDREVGLEVVQIASALMPANKRLTSILELAGRWHDLGKSHPAFQGAIRDAMRPDRADLAKAPEDAWLRPKGTYRTVDNRETRKGFRHELASCLALFAVLRRYEPQHPALLGPWMEALRLTGEAKAAAPAAPREAATPLERAVLECTAAEFDLLAYLVLSHHGKVRLSMNAGPKDQDYADLDGRGLPIRGLREDDVLPAIELAAGERLPELVLTLAPSNLGLSDTTGRSWRDRTLALTKQYGPAGLSWLESILIAADRRASRLLTPDPLLPSQEGPR